MKRKKSCSRVSHAFHASSSFSAFWPFSWPFLGPSRACRACPPFQRPFPSRQPLRLKFIHIDLMIEQLTEQTTMPRVHPRSSSLLPGNPGAGGYADAIGGYPGPV